MKNSKRILLVTFLAAGAINSYGQGATGAGQGQSNPNPGSDLPPGLDKRDQLPPGLSRRDQLPPGLERRTQPGYPAGTTNLSGTSAGQIGGVTGQGGQFEGVNATNRGMLGSITNHSGLTPTSDRGATNRMYGTNIRSINRLSATNILRDQAVTQQDRTVLVQVRQRVQPILASVMQRTTTPSPAASLWSPVHFTVRDRVVTLVGYVPTEEIRERIETTVERVPGVVQVINEIEVRDTTTVTQDQQPVINQSVGGGPTAGETTETTGFESSTTVGSATNRFRLGATNQAGGANGLTPTSRTNAGSSLYSTNQTGTTNLSPTSSNGASRYYTNATGLPPGLEKREQLPPGLDKREELPPGLERRTGTNQAP